MRSEVGWQIGTVSQFAASQPKVRWGEFCLCFSEQPSLALSLCFGVLLCYGFELWGIKKCYIATFQQAYFTSLMSVCVFAMNITWQWGIRTNGFTLILHHVKMKAEFGSKTPYLILGRCNGLWGQTFSHLFRGRSDEVLSEYRHTDTVVLLLLASFLICGEWPSRGDSWTRRLNWLYKDSSFWS